MKNMFVNLVLLVVPALAWAGPININTADAEAISAELTGVGMAKAEAIVAYRDQYGAFEVPEELLKVKGIGPRVLAANADNIRVAD